MRDVNKETRELYEEICRSPHHSRLIRAVENAPRRASEGTNYQFSIVLVPGIFYEDYPHTGADGAELRAYAQEMSLPFHVIPIDGTEGLAAGAARVVDWLLTHPIQGRCVLVSLSKGSAEVREALSLPGGEEAFAYVSAWVSISGLPLGTRVLELSLRNPVRRAYIMAACWLKGWNLDTIRDLLRPRPDAELNIPEHLVVVHVTAFPLREHLRDRRSRRLHRRLGQAGPNDGFALLNEITALPGYIYPVWGADHYMRSNEDIPERMARLLTVVSQEWWKFGEEA